MPLLLSDKKKSACQPWKKRSSHFVEISLVDSETTPERLNFLFQVSFNEHFGSEKRFPRLTSMEGGK